MEYSDFAPGGVGSHWRKSSRSTTTNCVELAGRVPGVAVRDSKNPDQPLLAFGPRGWSAFAAGTRSGRFDLR